MENNNIEKKARKMVIIIYSSMFHLNPYVSRIFYKYNKKIKILTFYFNFRTNRKE